MSFDGYVDKADNEAKLLRDCFAPGDCYLRTGDLLRRDRASYYYFVDRIGDTFRWKGENVATAEVAELLNGAPGRQRDRRLRRARPRHRRPRRHGAGRPRSRARRSIRRPTTPSPSGRCRRTRARCSCASATAMDVTGTLKHTKTRLQAEGYDPARRPRPALVPRRRRAHLRAARRGAQARIDSGSDRAVTLVLSASASAGRR